MGSAAAEEILARKSAKMRALFPDFSYVRQGQLFPKSARAAAGPVPVPVALASPAEILESEKGHVAVAVEAEAAHAIAGGSVGMEEGMGYVERI
ncbi:MAG: hypothetical protein NTW87_35410 [Planctomycetota bacterium]|nr:hypothetical protein [Planctomycetota bacterium]